MGRRGIALAALAGGCGLVLVLRRRLSTTSDAAARVTLATRLYAPEAAAAALRLRGLACALAERGAQVRVETSTPPGMQAPTDPGVQVRSLPALRNDKGYILGYVPYMSFDIPLALRLLCARRPDLLIAEPPPTTGLVTACVAALRGIPYAYYAADIWSDAAASTGAPQWVCAVLARVEGRVMRGARPVLAVSEGVAQRVRELGGREVTVVPNGIDTDTFTPEGPVAVQAPHEPYFLYAGTASTWQGAGIFLQAMERVWTHTPRARLVFLGQGSDWEELQRAAQGDERVIFHGLVPPSQAAAWQRGAVAALVSIKPGLGYDFAYPTKIFASLACGTPVIYAGPGPARSDIADADLGWVSDYDAEELAAAMIAALDAHAGAAEAGDEGIDEAALRRRAWVEEHRSMRTELGRAADRLLQGLAHTSAKA